MLPREEKSKFECKEKKGSVYYWKGRFVGVSGLKTQLSLINWTFFPHIQILIFHCKATQDDHIRSLYEFGTDKENLGCVGSCEYAPDSVKCFLSLMNWWNMLSVSIFSMYRWSADKTQHCGATEAS